MSMKKQIPAIVLAVISIVLAVSLYSAKQEIAQLQQQLHSGQPAETVVEAPASPGAGTPTPAPEATVAMTESPAPEPQPAAEEEAKERRMMKNIAKMMDNPAMNKVMEASQRGAVGAMYSDLIDYLGLSADEENYFMDLLMFRQMTQMDFGMKMMSGSLSDEEKKTMEEEVKDAVELVKTEMKAFLNNEEDFAEFEFFEKTQGERMMLSQAEAALTESDSALSEETYRELLEMMHEEKQNFDFSTDFADETNMDMSAERFSKENIHSFGNDMDRLNDNIFSKAQQMLTPEQLTAFEEAVTATTEMQKAQMEMAAQMFGGGK
jgi:hypothetical protein